MKLTKVAAFLAAISLTFSAMASEPTAGNTGGAPTEKQENKPETAAAKKPAPKKKDGHK